MPSGADRDALEFADLPTEIFLRPSFALADLPGFEEGPVGSMVPPR